MKKYALFTAVFLFSILPVLGQVQLQHLETESLINPIGLDAVQPRFSWQLVSARRNVLQNAYELRVSEDNRGLPAGKISWSTGKVLSGQSIYVPYGGAALVSGKRYYWQVRVWDQWGEASDWSAPAFFQMGLLQLADWKAQWIIPGFKEDSLRTPPLFRKAFTSAKKIQSATAYITAHGLYEAQINGSRVGNDYLTPGWTSYNKRLQYQVYDVTKLVKQGSNAVGVMVGNGWYRGDFSFTSRNLYGSDIALLFQLNIVYTDGSSESIVSDASWKSSTGAVLYSEIYAGEQIDARLNKNGWTLASYPDKEWNGVQLANFSKETLIATRNEPVKKHETMTPLKIITTPKGEQVLDFGQNLVGWVTLKVKGKAGTRITLSHAEVLDKQGEFYTTNLRSAKAQDCYILRGEGEEIFEPHFTWHGFRFVKVEGYPGALQPENFTAVALYSDMPSTGSFTSSNPTINQLQHNIEWGLRGNFLDVPTDCPQRDERLGWTGDAQVFFRTASFLRGVQPFFTKWMADLAADQRRDGSVPHVVPNTLGDIGWGGGSSAGWGDVANVIPWNLYLVYGDKHVLEQQYPSMKAWVEYIRSQSTNNLWNKGRHYGDWLFYSVNDDNDGSSAITDKYLIAQCFYVHSTQLLINAANALGKKEEAASYTTLLQNIKDAFVKEYVTPNGTMVSNTQTAYVLALQFDLLPQALRQQAADRLVKNIGLYNYHLTTGFLGTPYLCHVLSRFGYTDVAYKLLLQETYPSWLYPVKKGATTIWERWNGIHTDDSFETPTMNSFNHYAYGAIGDWMYRVMVGLDTEEEGVGYQKIRIQPHIGGGFTQAAASYVTPYGQLSAGWKLENGALTVDAEVPANTTATIYLPKANADSVMESGKVLPAIKEIQVVQKEKEYLVIKVGSGKYHFQSNYRP